MLVVVLWTSALVACQADDDSPDPLSRDEPVDYVAIGDSYTAAPLVPTTDASDTCLRSNGNYPHLIAAELSAGRLVDVSCSGADTTDLTGRQVNHGQTKAPQLDAVTAETDLVTIGIGGNDLSLFGSMVVGCLELYEDDPQGAPCRDHNRRGAGDRLLDLIPRIQGRLSRAIEQVQNRAPDATVVMVDYPRILPPSGTCPDRLPLADGDYAYVDSVNRALSDAIRAAAGEAGVISIDVYAASRGHDVCSDQPWVNGIATDPGRALALHPFPAEQQAVADLVLDAL